MSKELDPEVVAFLGNVPVFGRALFGKLWQADLSRDLHISKSLLSRTLRGEREPPPRLAYKIKEVVLARVSDASALLDLPGMPFAGSERMAKAQALIKDGLNLLRGEEEATD